MIKKIICCVLMMFVSSVMHGMKNLITEVGTIVSSPQAKIVETEVVQFVNSDTGKTVIADIENEGKILFADAEKFITNKFSHSTTTSIPTTSTITTNTTTTSTTATSTTAPITVNGNEIPPIMITNLSQDSSNSLSNSQVPNLNLRSYPSSKLTSRGSIQPKNTVASLNQLHTNVATGKKSARQPQNESSSTQTTRLGQSANLSSAPKRSMALNGMGDNALIANVMEENKMYSEEDVWAMVQYSNPALYQFGVEHSMSLDNVMMYAQFLQEMKVKPAVLVEHVKTVSKLGDKKPADWQLMKYKEIQKKDPEKWDAMVLEVLKAVVEQQDGEAKPSTLNSTHIGMLESKVTGQDGQIYAQYAAIIVSALLTLGTAVWGIYGQVTHASDTNAPTNAPTYTPTFAPTLSPT